MVYNSSLEWFTPKYLKNTEKLTNWQQTKRQTYQQGLLWTPLSKLEIQDWATGETNSDNYRFFQVWY